MRSIVSSSTGGNVVRKIPTGPNLMNAVTRSASSSSGPRPFAQRGTWTDGRSPWTGRSAVRSAIASLADREHARPPELGELALVCVEHEGARVLVAELDDRALALAHRHDRSEERRVG